MQLAFPRMAGDDSFYVWKVEISEVSGNLEEISIWFPPQPVKCQITERVACAAKGGLLPTPSVWLNLYILLCLHLNVMNLFINISWKQVKVWFTRNLVLKKALAMTFSMNSLTAYFVFFSLMKRKNIYLFGWYLSCSLFVPTPILGTRSTTRNRTLFLFLSRSQLNRVY